MKRFNIKSLTAGLIIGMITASTVTAFGLVYASGKVEAWIQDKQVRIMVDGSYVDIPDDMHVLNYNNRVYTPVRLVAESLGATVGWEEARQAVIIESPETEIIEVEKEVETKIVYEYYYSPLPIRRIINDTSINIIKVERYKTQTFIHFDMTTHPQFPIIFREDRTYIEADGVKYPYEEGFRYYFNNTFTEIELDSGEDIAFGFEKVPDDVKDITIHLGIELYDGKMYNDNPEVLEFVFRVNTNEDDKY